MSKKYYPFLIALFLHVLIVIVSGLLIDDVPNLLITETKNLINVNFSSGNLGGKEGGKEGGKVSKKVSSLSSEPNLNSTSSSIGNTNQSSSGNGIGFGSGSGTGSGEASGISFGDAVTSFKEPAYPRLAIRRGIEGSIKIKISISPAGIPQEIVVLNSSGHDILDNAAIEAAKTWRFQAQSLAYTVTKTIDFQIKN
ncbi:MAG: energy transducer TonB [Bacteriovoracaceae bacterium]|nr:energy transducer TonB [Bacteriovoracaceae bacterium]